ncbi:hypothetical protein JW906_12575 [bacterium]|nr:hypothetical protein [bacterium]
MRLRFSTCFRICLVILAWCAGASALPRKTFHLSGNQPPVLAGNAVIDIVLREQAVWVAAGEGLSLTGDSGLTWRTWTREHGFGKGGLSAVAVRGQEIWIATAYDTLIEGQGSLPAGGGLAYSTDGGGSWTTVPQPKDARDVTSYKPTTTHINNLTYDIALTDSAVWIASFAGGLRRSMDHGATWDIVTVDGAPFDVVGHLSHRMFSVFWDGEVLWAGSAGGVHKSTDGGDSWTTFTHQNQPKSISGNFVVAIGCQRWDDRKIIWAATIEALDEGEYRAVSRSEDGGLTWDIELEGEWAHNFCCDRQNVFVATDNGVFKSESFGYTWTVFRNVVDSETGDPLLTTEMYSVGAGPGTWTWLGSSDGLAATPDEGLTWKIFRAFEIPGESGNPLTYAYPNPFSYTRDNLLGGDGHVRFQYRTAEPENVTVEVYDFSMALVRNVVQDKPRPVPGDYAEAWDGRNDLGEPVANGVYFYRLRLSGGGEYWGKVIILN